MKKTKYKNSTTRSHKCTVHKRHCAPYGKGIKVDSNSQRKTTFQSYHSENLNTNTHFTQHKLHHLKFYTKFRQHNWHSLRKSIIGHTSEPYFERLQRRCKVASLCIRHTAFIDCRKLKKTRLARLQMTRFTADFFNINHSFRMLKVDTYHIISYHIIISYLIYHISYHHIISYRIIYIYIISHIISYHIVSYRTVPYRNVSYRIVSYCTVPYRIISYIISYHIISHIISYHILSYRISYHIISRQHEFLIILLPFVKEKFGLIKRTGEKHANCT